MKEIKEKFCYVAKDFDSEVSEANSTTHKDEQYVVLPDDYEIAVKGSVRVQTTELLFQPELDGK